MAWEIVFMLVLLKIPIIYVCVVIWWAIKAEPTPPELSDAMVLAETPPGGGPSRRRRGSRPRPTRPHGHRRGGGSPTLQRDGART